MPLMRTECGRLRALSNLERQNLTVGWVQLALSNLEFLNGLFLNAARSLSVRYQQETQKERYASLAVRYKLLCVKFVIDAIGDSRESEPMQLSDILVAETLVLAFDEVSHARTMSALSRRCHLLTIGSETDWRHCNV